MVRHVLGQGWLVFVLLSCAKNTLVQTKVGVVSVIPGPKTCLSKDGAGTGLCLCLNQKKVRRRVTPAPTPPLRTPPPPGGQRIPLQEN